MKIYYTDDTPIVAFQTIDWIPKRAITALGRPKIYGKNNNGKPVRYPAKGTRDLIIFPTKYYLDFPEVYYYPYFLKDIMFRIKAKNQIFIVPHVMTGTYTCEITASCKNSLPGQAKMTLYTDAIVENNEPQWFKGDSNVMESDVSDLLYSVSCRATGFSWQRNPEEKVEFENNWESGVPLITMQNSKDPHSLIYSLVLWTAPGDLDPHFKDPAVLIPNEENDNQKKVSP
ncbi:hypothetical protein [Photorhabdus khanii]|uniref:Uncharacterized protein n=1 Tax=Photorhabdus khanii subsp. guanajuatensis TaxID=2100166 RepID=A0A4R4J6N5_9GAMM|nr:hypothetical protein [Photorhabdus khanii]TDB49297.1 hypothetical protein C5467_17730 [Photorhabdus khanii subsp. guanajuatensis]